MVARARQARTAAHSHASAAGPHGIIQGAGTTVPYRAMSQSASHAHRRIDQQVRTAERHLGDGELAAADVAATLALALDPAHPGAQLIFARIQRARGHWADARGSLQSLLAARPADAAQGAVPVFQIETVSGKAAPGAAARDDALAAIRAW